MSLNLSSISELPLVANSIDDQIAALTSTVINNGKAQIEVSYLQKNNSTIASMQFDFGKFMKYIVDSLSWLSANFKNYMPKDDPSLNNAIEDLKQNYLPLNYVYANYIPNCTPNSPAEQQITAVKKFNAVNLKTTTFATPVTINNLTASNINSTNSTTTNLFATTSKLTSVNATSINTNNLACTAATSELTARAARWN